MHNPPVVKIDINLDIQKFIDISAKLYVSYKTWGLHNQLSVTSRYAFPDDTNKSSRLSGSCGSLTKLKIKAKDEDFKYLNPEFIDLYPLISAIEATTNRKICRLLFRNLLSKTNVSYHKDSAEQRVHFVIDTTENNFFIVDDRLYRMSEIGGVYLLNTNIKHTAVNADYSRDRLHLVGTLC